MFTPSLYIPSSNPIINRTTDSSIDQVEQKANALGRVFTNIASPTGESSISDQFELMVMAQQLEVEANRTKKEIKALNLSSPELAASFELRYQSILENLQRKVNSVGLDAIRQRESGVKEKLEMIKNAQESISTADTFDFQMQMNSFQQMVQSFTKTSELIHALR